MALQALEAAAFEHEAAVVVCQGTVGLHAGIAYKDSDPPTTKVIELAWHHLLRAEAPRTGVWSWAVPAVDPLDLEVLRGLCALRAGCADRIPYGFVLGGSHFDRDGHFVAGSGGNGLTCATFVIAMFAWAKIALISGADWHTREDDIEAQRGLVEYLRRDGRVSPEHVAAVEREVGCMRFRVEEVAAASAVDSRPLGFSNATAAGANLLLEFRILQSGLTQGRNAEPECIASARGAPSASS